MVIPLTGTMCEEGWASRRGNLLFDEEIATCTRSPNGVHTCPPEGYHPQPYRGHRDDIAGIAGE